MKKRLPFKPFQTFLFVCFIFNFQFSIFNCTAQPYTVFECNFDNWTDGKPDGWSFSPSTPPSAVPTVSQYTPAFSGSYSCKVEGGPAGATMIATETFPMYWGKKYILSFTVKATTVITDYRGFQVSIRNRDTVYNPITGTISPSGIISKTKRTFF